MELDRLEEPTEENASMLRGDWIHTIRPVMKNLSKSSMKYWTILESVVEERYKRYLASSPVERLKLDFKGDEEASKDEYSKVRAIISEMLLKAISKDLVIEAAQKRHEDPTKATLMIMVKYQPGSKREKEAFLQQTTSPEACWNEEKAVQALKIWKSENVDASKIPIKYWNDKSCINEAIVQIFLKI
jgi:hypothetical protein